MKYLFVLLILVAGLLPASCGVLGRSSAPEPPASIRTPQPTFTPAPPQPAQAAQPAQSQDQEGDTDSEPTDPITQEITLTEAARAVVNSPLVNVRTGPSTDYEVVAVVERGQEFEIAGRNPQGDWWFVCCADGDHVWIINELVDTDGPVDSVPVTGAATETDEPTSSPDSVVTPSAPAEDSVAVPAPVAQFDLIRQEQFAETALVRVFLYVTDGTTGLEGYSARITKDGRELPVDATSFSGQPAFTWPFQDARQRHQNFRIEFADESAAGVWEIELINADGESVGPAARFTLTDEEPDKELYLRYERR
jgi:hypothetical protein